MAIKTYHGSAAGHEEALAKVEQERRAKAEALANPVLSPEEKVRVLDLSAVVGERQHLVGGKNHRFEPHEWLEMTWKVGSQFVPLDGFRVETMEGRPLRAVTRVLGPNDVVHLRTDQVVAGLNELTSEALLERCRKYADGNVFSSSSDRMHLQAFLLDRANEEVQRGAEELKVAADRLMHGGGSADR